MLSVSSGRVTDPACRDQRAHEVCRNPRMSGRAPERLNVMRLGGPVVSVERRGDGETVLDPGRHQRVLPGFARVLEALPGNRRPALGERRPSCTEQGLRLRGRCFARPRRGFEKMAFRDGEVTGIEGDVGEPEGRFWSVVEMFGEGLVDPLGNGSLSGGQRGFGDRQVAAERIAGPWRVVRHRRAGAGSQETEDGDCRRRKPCDPLDSHVRRQSKSCSGVPNHDAGFSVSDVFGPETSGRRCRSGDERGFWKSA